MITLNAKEYLNHVRFVDRLINVKDKELHRLRLSYGQYRAKIETGEIAI